MRQFFKTFGVAIGVSFVSGVASVFAVGAIRRLLANRKQKQLAAVPGGQRNVG